MSFDVAIVGAGIAGLTAALCLHRSGHRPILYEKAEALEPVGAGIQITPNAWHVLDALGLGDALTRVGVEVEAVVLHRGGSGRSLAAIPFGDAGRTRYGAPYVVLHRGALQRVLLDAVQTQGIGLRLGWRGDIQRYDLLVAADGVHSHLRRRQFGIPAVHSGFTAWRTIVDIAPLPIERNEVGVWLFRNAHLVAYHMGDGRLNCVSILKSRDYGGEAYDNRPPLPRGTPRSLKHAAWSPWPIFSVTPCFGKPGEALALIGDAAHAMLPFAAQGGAQAIEDAAVLAREAESGATPASIVAAYAAARGPRVRRVQALARRNGRVYHLWGPVGRVRDAVLRTASPTMARDRLDWLYDWKPPKSLS